jgi:hypothetical protein
VREEEEEEEEEEGRAELIGWDKPCLISLKGDDCNVEEGG